MSGGEIVSIEVLIESLQERLQTDCLKTTNRITEEEAIELYELAPDTTLRLLAHRDRMHRAPAVVTYLIDRNVNYTNICTINCQFCSFYRPPGHEETYTQTIDQISARISELEEIEGSRVLMQGGVNPELGIEYYEDLLTTLTKRHPTIKLDVFSPIEISGISEVTGFSTLEVLQRLQAVGMHGLPGGGAEMLVDGVRSDISPKKGAADDWIRIMREAQSLSLTTSATNVIGFGESKSDRVMHLSKIRDAQDDAHAALQVGFTSFIAWPVQLENNVFGRRNKGQNRLKLGVQAAEYLRHVAVSRLFLDNIDHIQASWPTMGLDVAQIALFGGADDIGSTMMEENVVSASGTTRVQVSEKELQETILRAGFTPMRRDSDYVLLKTPDLKLGIQDLPCPPPII